MRLFVLEVRRASGHGDSSFSAMISEDFGKVLEAARTVQTAGGYHGFSDPERHAITISALVPGVYYKHRSIAGDGDDSDRTLVFIRRPQLQPPDAKYRESESWKEEWLDRDLMMTHAPDGTLLPF
jgi:hypothetical protein